MSVMVICAVLVAAFLVTALKGAPWAFISVFIPALIMLNQLPEIQIPHAPLNIQAAALYGILFGLPLRTDSLRFKICSVDIIFILLLFSAVITGWSTEVFETGINTFRTDFLWLTAPYFLARISFQKWQVRKGTLVMLIILLAVISSAALIEFRLTPYFYDHVLDRLGMHNKLPIQTYQRWNYFRVAGPTEHPIYFGNMCVVLLGMVAALASTSGVKLSNPWVITAMFACLGCVFVSISYTPYLGVIAGIMFFLALRFISITRTLLVPLTLFMICVIGGYTYHIAHEPLGDKPETNDMAGSVWIRKLIITQAWQKAAIAGPFGWGLHIDFTDDDPLFKSDDSFDLKSVDNSYLQFTMTHGWVYTMLWISIGVFYSWRATRGFMAAKSPAQVFPLAVCTSTILALMVSMYTVWAGALYTVIWAIMLGLANTLIDSIIAASKGLPVTVVNSSQVPRQMPRPQYSPAYASRAGLRIAES